MRLAVLALAAACSSPPAREARPAPPDTTPRLVVLLVIDQWPQWAFVQKRPALTRGFARLLREGEWHTGVYPSSATLTAPNHALLGSGEPTATSGILANEWWDRDLERMVKSIEAPDGTVSPQRLRVPGLGDAIAAAKTGAKAVAVSMKDRAAILPLGHHGTAIWYDKRALSLASTAAPAWLAEHARTHPIAPHLADVWSPLDPARLAQLSGTTDDQAGETGTKGFGVVFPHAVAKTPDPPEALYATPFGTELVIDTALAAIDGERLGADAVPDLLVVSVSSHDYVNHGWGHESWESWDYALRLDGELERFLAALDDKVGRGRWAMIATSDHGAAPLPERHGAGRITYDQVKDAANRAAVAELGAGDWIASAKFPTVYLTAAGRAAPTKNKALTKIVFALRSFPGIGRVEKTAELAGDCASRTGDAFVLCLALDRERSGEVVYLPARHWIFHAGDEPAATAHGSPYDYDREVPVIMLAPGRTMHAPAEQPSETAIQMVRISAVLARWLGVTPPQNLRR